MHWCKFQFANMSALYNQLAIMSALNLYFAVFFYWAKMVKDKNVRHKLYWQKIEGMGATDLSNSLSALWSILFNQSSDLLPILTPPKKTKIIQKHFPQG